MVNKYARVLDGSRRSVNLHLTEPMLLHNQYDALFKVIITGGWGVKSDGDVEAPTGAFALVEIPDHIGERREMSDACNLEEIAPHFLDFDWLEPGWYVASENSDGLIFVYHFPSRIRAQVAYKQLEAQYQQWWTFSSDDEDITKGDEPIESTVLKMDEYLDRIHKNHTGE